MTDLDPASLRQQYGLPSEPLANRHFVIDPASRTLVLAGTPRTKGSLPQVYVRRVHEQQYEAVVERIAQHVQVRPGAELMVTTWVLGWNSTLFCAVSEAGARIDERVRSVEHVCIAAVGLGESRCETWEQTHGARSDLILSELLAAREDEEALYAVAGFPSAERQGPVKYHIVRIGWRTGVVEKIASMDSAFF